MTIIEGNKLIAEFEGWEFTSTEDNLILGCFETHKRWIINQKEFDNLLLMGFKFHKSWKRLMSIVEKINEIAIDNYGEMGVYIYPFQCFIGYDIHEPITLVQRLDKTLIEMVWTTITTFIQWHNTIKSKVN